MRHSTPHGYESKTNNLQTKHKGKRKEENTYRITISDIIHQPSTLTSAKKEKREKERKGTNRSGIANSRKPTTKERSESKTPDTTPAAMCT